MHRIPTVAEWVDFTVYRIQHLNDGSRSNRTPTRVLEMGCGNGMILFRAALLSGVEKYIGADLSTEAIEYVCVLDVCYAIVRQV